MAEVIDNIAIDTPKALQLLAIMVKGAELDQERLLNLASMSDKCLESIPCHACSKAAGFRQVFCFMWWMTLTLGDKYVVVGFGSVLLLYH